MNDTRILIVDDHNDINNMIHQHLSANDYWSDQAFSGTEALLLIRNNDYDLIILDLMLPGLDGDEVLKEIRENLAVPVIVLTAKNDLQSKVDLLKAGADDYLCKPFDIEELLVRIQVQLRKANRLPLKHQFKDLTIDAGLYDAKIGHKRLHLTKHEYLIVELLAKNPQRVFTKQDIYEYAWGENYLGDDKTINVHISNIRKKISEITDDEYIKTVWGIGFKMAE